MSEEKRVRIADGSQDTQDRLHTFVRTQKKLHPEKKLRSLESGIIFAMDQAERVPELEKMIKELEKALAELEENYKHDIEVMKEL